MDLITFKNTVGREEVTRICKEAGTNYEYYKHLMNKRPNAQGKPRYPSVKLAKKLVAASGNRLDFMQIFS